MEVADVQTPPHDRTRALTAYQNCSRGPKIWPTVISRGKNFGCGFLDSFGLPEPFPATRLVKIIAVKALPDWRALLVRNCRSRSNKAGARAQGSPALLTTTRRDRSMRADSTAAESLIRG